MHEHEQEYEHAPVEYVDENDPEHAAGIFTGHRHNLRQHRDDAKQELLALLGAVGRRGDDKDEHV